MVGVRVGPGEDVGVDRLGLGVIEGDELGITEVGKAVVVAGGARTVELGEGWKIGKDIRPQERSARRMNIIKK